MSMNIRVTLRMFPFIFFQCFNIYFRKEYSIEKILLIHFILSSFNS